MRHTTAATPWTFAARTARMNASAIREILKLAEQPCTLSLAGGLPSADTFPSDGVREATAFGPVAPQPGMRDRVMSEDCLHLNVWTPALGLQVI